MIDTRNQMTQRQNEPDYMNEDQAQKRAFLNQFLLLSAHIHSQ